MAFTIPGESGSDANEWGYDGLMKLHDLFTEAADANIIAGDNGALTRDRVITSGQKLPLYYPAVRLSVISDTESYHEMGPTGTGKRRLDLSYAVEVMEYMTKAEDTARSLSKIVDRSRDLLSRNRDLDGFCVDLLVSPTTRGFVNSQGRHVLAAQLTVSMWKRVDMVAD